MRVSGVITADAAAAATSAIKAQLERPNWAAAASLLAAALVDAQAPLNESSLRELWSFAKPLVEATLPKLPCGYGNPERHVFSFLRVVASRQVMLDGVFAGGFFVTLSDFTVATIRKLHATETTAYGHQEFRAKDSDDSDDSDDDCDSDDCVSDSDDDEDQLHHRAPGHNDPLWAITGELVASHLDALMASMGLTCGLPGDLRKDCGKDRVGAEPLWFLSMLLVPRNKGLAQVADLKRRLIVDDDGAFVQLLVDLLEVDHWTHRLDFKSAALSVLLQLAQAPLELQTALAAKALHPAVDTMGYPYIAGDRATYLGLQFVLALLCSHDAGCAVPRRDPEDAVMKLLLLHNQGMQLLLDSMEDDILCMPVMHILDAVVGSGVTVCPQVVASVMKYVHKEALVSKNACCRAAAADLISTACLRDTKTADAVQAAEAAAAKATQTAAATLDLADIDAAAAADAAVVAARRVDAMTALWLSEVDPITVATKLLTSVELYGASAASESALMRSRVMVWRRVSFSTSSTRALRALLCLTAEPIHEEWRALVVKTLMDATKPTLLPNIITPLIALQAAATDATAAATAAAAAAATPLGSLDVAVVTSKLTACSTAVRLLTMVIDGQKTGLVPMEPGNSSEFAAADPLTMQLCACATALVNMNIMEALHTFVVALVSFPTLAPYRDDPLHSALRLLYRVLAVSSADDTMTRALQCGVVTTMARLLTFSADAASATLFASEAAGRVASRVTWTDAIAVLSPMLVRAGASTTALLQSQPGFLTSVLALAQMPAYRVGVTATLAPQELASGRKLATFARILLQKVAPDVVAHQSDAGVDHLLSLLPEVPAAEHMCTFCFTGEGTTQVRLPCLHMFHSACVKDWLRTAGTCPMCVRPAIFDIVNLVAAPLPSASAFLPPRGPAARVAPAAAAAAAPAAAL